MSSLGAVVLLLTIGGISAQEESLIPSWIKNTASFWVDDQISDQEFIAALQFLVSKNILTIPDGDESITVDIDAGPGVENIEIPVTDETRDKVQPSNLDLLQFQISQLKELTKNPKVIAALVESNDKFGAMSDPYSYIDKIDDEWKIQPKDTDSQIMQDLMSNEISDILRTKTEIKTEEFGDVLFPEMILTNALGANVAITQRTDDYDQADELWWIRAKKASVQILDVMYDESTNLYSEDLIIRIDNDNGKLIGVLKAVSPVR